MPKQITSEFKFTLGSFCGMDLKDIPEGGFALSEHVDPTRKLGAAMPRLDDDKYNTNSIEDSTTVIPTSGIQYNDGTNDITVVHMDSDDDIRYATAVGAWTDIGNLPTGATPAKCQFINAADGSLRIASAKTIAPQWFGKITRDQYVKSGTPIETDAYTMESALIQPEFACGGTISTEYDGTNWYFLLNNQQYLYKWDGSSDIFQVTRSDKKMSHPVKVILETTDSEVYVLDDVSRNIYVFNTSLVLQRTIKLNDEIADGTWGSNSVPISFAFFRDTATINYFVVLWGSDITAPATSQRKISILQETSGSISNENTSALDLAGDMADVGNTYFEASRQFGYAQGSLNNAGDRIANLAYDDLACSSTASDIGGDTGFGFIVGWSFGAGIVGGNAGGVLDIFEYNTDTDTLTQHQAAQGLEPIGDVNHVPMGAAFIKKVGDEHYFALLYRMASNSHLTFTGTGTKVQRYSWNDVTNNLTYGTEDVWDGGDILTRDKLTLSHEAYDASSDKIQMTSLGAPSAVISTIDGTAATLVSYHSFGVSGRIESGGAAGSIPSTYKEFYKIAMVFDGYQISALNLEPICYTARIGGAETDYLSYQLKFMIPSAMNNKRWTALQVFRAESSSETAMLPDTAYQYVTQVAIDGDVLTNTDLAYEATYTTTGALNKYVFEINDDTSLSGVTFEQLSGTSSSLPNSIMNYKYAVIGQASLYALSCSNQDVSDIDKYLFRSGINTVDSFNWGVSFAKLPLNDEPTAIGFFQGRVIAWDADTMVIVNGTTLVVEDIYNGIGCISQQTVVSTQYGLFWADAGHIYQWTGGVPKMISKNIEQDGVTSIYGWQTSAASKRIYASAAFDTNRGQYIILMYDNSVGYVGIYTVEQNRWDFTTIGTGVRDGQYHINSILPLFQGLDGIVLFAGEDYQTGPTHNYHYIYDLYGKTTYKAPNVYTKEHTFGSGEQQVKLYKIRWNSTDTGLQVTAAYDGGSLGALTEAANVAGQVYEAPLGTSKYYKARFLFAIGNDSADELSSYSIVYRPMRIK